MTAALLWAIIILGGSALFLAGEVEGRRRERRVRERMRRRLAELAYDELTIRLANADAADLADNARWSRNVTRRFEVVR
jgi:tRNA A37 N6-isopentenylltransferase MiaA